MPFSVSTLQFLTENRLQNSKAWFDAHLQEYQTLLMQPLQELHACITPALLSLDDLLDCNPRTATSRIYRDVRFSKDKSRYRDVMWLIYMRSKKLYQGLPGFFFEIGPYGFRYGCGYYTASTASMHSIRELILKRDPLFLAAQQKTPPHFSLLGESYRRSKAPDQPEAIRAWLDKKNYCMICTCEDFDLLFSNRLADFLIEEFHSLNAFYWFLTRAEQQKQP